MSKLICFSILIAVFSIGCKGKQGSKKVTQQAIGNSAQLPTNTGTVSAGSSAFLLSWQGLSDKSSAKVILSN